MIPTHSIPLQNRLSDSEQSRKLDQSTINDFGIDGFTLMELAALGAASHIKKKEGADKSGLYICGKGNNAGDALAVARYMNNDANHKITLFLIFGDVELSPDADKNLELLRNLKNHGCEISTVSGLDEVNFTEIDYIVDGIFGTGLNSDLRDPLPEIIEKLNSTGKPIHAMDIPSGLNADSGIVHGISINANYTYTFGTNKQGFYLNKGPERTGEIAFIDLPFPNYLRQSKTFLIDEHLMASLPGINRSARHKYEEGVVHILAGSEGLTGAAIMAAKSAWKQGAGAVFLYAPKKLMPVYESTLPQIIKIGLGSETDAFYKPDHAETILQSIKKRPGFLLAGPGIGTQKATGNCLVNVLESFPGNVLLDADALSFWEKLRNIPEKKKINWLLTPHIGEAKNYLAAMFDDDFSRLQWAKMFTKHESCSLLLKGNPLIIQTMNGITCLTGYDTSVFARAGFGDVLSGSIAALGSVTSNMQIAAIYSLWGGYQNYINHKKADIPDTFGPEHLL